MHAQTIAPGFARPVHDSQQSFRAILDAMSRPGRLVALPEPEGAGTGMFPGTAAAALTLLDNDTRVRTVGFKPEADAWLRFHCGCHTDCDAADAAFIFYRDGASLPDLRNASVGSDENPHSSATLIIQVESLRTGDALRLEGPGIREEERLYVSGLDRQFWSVFSDNRALYPLGFDVILISPEDLASLPRTVTARGPIACM